MQYAELYFTQYIQNVRKMGTTTTTKLSGRNDARSIQKEATKTRHGNHEACYHFPSRRLSFALARRCSVFSVHPSSARGFSAAAAGEVMRKCAWRAQHRSTSIREEWRRRQESSKTKETRKKSCSNHNWCTFAICTLDLRQVIAEKITCMAKGNPTTYNM